MYTRIHHVEVTLKKRTPLAPRQSPHHRPKTALLDLRTPHRLHPPLPRPIHRAHQQMVSRHRPPNPPRGRWRATRPQQPRRNPPRVQRPSRRRHLTHHRDTPNLTHLVTAQSTTYAGGRNPRCRYAAFVAIRPFDRWIRRFWWNRTGSTTFVNVECSTRRYVSNGANPIGPPAKCRATATNTSRSNAVRP